ncbi:hypothetical protein JXA47_11625, partial [Candidatus Sumerlaeota bacterium]|nr:hypothetical protein [Candidatus Sumerlaeota bacterium]
PRRVPAWAPGILLGDGTHLSGRILRTEDDGLLVKPRFSDAAHVPLDEIRAVYPDPPADEGYFHYPIQTHATRICRLTSVGGDQFSGLIDELGESVVVNTPEMTTVRLPRSDVLHCVFPMSPRLWAGERIGAEAPLTPRRIDMWGHRRQTSDDLPYRENLIAQINQVTHDLGFSLEWIDDTALVTGQLTPQTAPILLVVDEREAFPLTISSPGDGLAALTDYLREGGVLVLIPAGIPFWHGREWDGQQWNARPLRQQVANDMGFAFLTPGIPRADARAFEIPDNRGETLTFERMSSESPWTLLPTALGFPSLEDSRFRPILPLDTGSPARLEPIYELRTDTGEACGTAMASIIHTGGELSGSRIYHVSPALAQAIDETGEPALHRILPAIIADALAPMDGIPPDSLTPGSGGTVAQP